MHPLQSFRAGLEYSSSVTALAFDPVSDQLWSGNQEGVVSAFQGHSNERGVTFPVCRSDYSIQSAGVHKIVAGDDVVRASTLQNGVGGWNKGGTNKWYFPNTTVSTFTPTTSPTISTLVALSSTEIVLLNTTSYTVTSVRKSISPSMVTHLVNNTTHHSLAVAGCADGLVRAYDTRTTLLRAAATTPAHQGGFSSLATSGNYAYSTGWGIRSGRPHPDPFVKVYDLRGSCKSLTSLPFHGGPTFVAVHPTRPSMIYVVPGEGGFVQTVDIREPTEGGENIPIVSSSFMTAFAISPTGAYLALGDSAGYIHILTSTSDDEDRIPYNGFTGQEIAHPDPPEPLPEIQWTETTPLNSMGMPLYTSALLSSNLPSPSRYPASPPQSIPAHILSTMKLDMNGMGSAAVPPELKGKRNMTVLKVSNGNKPSRARFRSVKSSEEPETPVGTEDAATVPRKYRKVEIEYSKFGVDDFDFEFYNKTSHSGLETHILNSYTNALVQVAFHTSPIRALAKSHLTAQCPRENCLLCEFGFVARMVEDAKGVNCQTSNFCKVIGFLPQAQAMGLVDYAEESASHRTDYSSMIQMFNRFLLEQFSLEISPFRSSILRDPGTKYDQDPITQLVGIRATTITECTNCGTQSEKSEGTRLIDLVYGKGYATFSDTLIDSFARESAYKAICPVCRGQGTRSGQCVFKVSRHIDHSELPPVLVVNAGLSSSESKAMWSSKDGGFLNSPTIDLDGVRYNIRAVVAEVEEGGKAPHLVAFVQVSEGDNPEDSWYMFNDFVVQRVDESEALDFTPAWKTPSIFYFERADLNEIIDLTGLPMQLNTEILSQDISMSPNRDSLFIRHQPFDPEELPTAGTLISIDAEFVQMQQEEVEYRADGSKKVLRPSRLSLARVSVIRGQGPLQGTPCIDDHIHTSEVIVNYLTEFSGIKFGDLDPHLSRHTLVPLKVAYKKLRLLVDLGCVFIGHGLLKDFRIINIFVPRHQVLDTVDLYFLPERQRRLSLRFLTWFILKEDIQQDTHDSIEDSVSALRLYNAYEDFEERGVVEEKLLEAYRVGKQNNWKPPGSDRQNTVSPPPIPPSGSATPPQITPMSSFQSSISQQFQLPSPSDMSPSPSQIPTFHSSRHLQHQNQNQNQNGRSISHHGSGSSTPSGSGFYSPATRSYLTDQTHGNLSWRRQA